MNIDKNKKIGLGIVGVIVLIAVFYGGVIYGKNQIPTKGQNFSQNNVNGVMRGTKTGAGNMMGGFTSGEIISKDDKSITVKLQNGGSKIIFLGENTTVSKMATGNATDLTTGTQVSITGTPNTDGSITAQTIQIRPNISPSVLK